MTQKEFVQTLRENFETKFKFQKKDCTEREARGTLNFDMIPKESTPKGTQTWEDPDDIVKYWDLDKEAWRSFRWDQFIELL